MVLLEHAAKAKLVCLPHRLPKRPVKSIPHLEPLGHKDHLTVPKMRVGGSNSDTFHFL